MFKHYLTAALRHFARHRLTTAINVVCLTIGLVCFLASHSMVTYLRGADRHFDNSDRIHMIRWSMNGSLSASAAPWLAGRHLKSDIPELETVARASIDVGIRNQVPIAAGDRKTFAHIAYADAELLDVFALPFLAGDSRNALRSPHSAVVSEDLAKRIFGDVSAATGRQLRFQDGSEVTIRGVVGALRQPSHITTEMGPSMGHLRFELLVSMDVLEHDASLEPMIDNWGSPMFLTYTVLPKDGSFTADDLDQRLATFGKRHADSKGNTYRFTTTKLSDYWLGNFGVLSGSATPARAGIAMFYFLGIVVLLISCLNYANLATAQGAARAKEIGMRRVVGANRLQVAAQFFSEAATLSLVSLVAALLIFAVGVATLGVPSAKATAVATLGSLEFWSTLIAVLFFVTVAAGFYPAVVFSRVRPIQAVRTGNIRSGNRVVSRLLVASQFAGASFLTITMLVMWVQNRTLAQNVLQRTDSALVTMANDVAAAGVSYETLKADLERQPHIESVTATMLSPWVMVGGQGSASISPEANASRHAVMMSRVHYDYFSTLGIKLLAGRPFDREHADDHAYATQSATIVDRAFAEQHGWVPFSEAVGKAVYEFNADNLAMPPKRRTVIAVVDSMPNSILTPFGATSSMYLLIPEQASLPIIRISTSDVSAALKEIESVWTRLAPSVALKLQFADQLLNDSYRVFKVISTVLAGVTVLALCISLLGLIGMSLDVIGRRRHEIGVRKTLGASVQSIVRLLLTDFSKPVVAANLLMWPFAFFAMQAYLSIFTQRTGLSFGPFIASFTFTVLIAWIAVAAQATRAARLNPATVLRYE